MKFGYFFSCIFHGITSVYHHMNQMSIFHGRPLFSTATVKGERLINVVKGRSDAMGVPFEELMSKITANYSLGRAAEESEVAAAAVFLASDE